MSDREILQNPLALTLDHLVFVLCILLPYLMWCSFELKLPGIPLIGPYSKYEAVTGISVLYFQYFILAYIIYSIFAFRQLLRFRVKRFEYLLHKYETVKAAKGFNDSLCLVGFIFFFLSAQFLGPYDIGFYHSKTGKILFLCHSCLLFAIASLREIFLGQYIGEPIDK